MYFKTLKISETGKKFQAVIMDMDRCNRAAEKFIEDSGVKCEGHATSSLYIAGGVAGFTFRTRDDIPENFRKPERHGNLFVALPKVSKKLGRNLMNSIQDLPKVNRIELNRCIGMNTLWHSIGFYGDHQEFFIFESDDTKFTYPDDCQEIVHSEYVKLSEELE